MVDLVTYWFVPTALIVLGSVVLLSMLGFAYERAICERKSILMIIESRRYLKWSVVGLMLIEIGFLFTRASYLLKAGSVFLGLLLAVLISTSSVDPRKYKGHGV